MPGIVAAVASRIASAGGNITEAQQFEDSQTGNFFMRVAFSTDETLERLRATLGPEATRFSMDWALRPADAPRRVMILVSRFDHCLVDLLYRTRIGELNAEIVAIVSNHPREVVGLPADMDTPFHHFPITAATKVEQEGRIRSLVAETDAELVVLARYMQVLSDGFSAELAGKCINIHHSFLPGFKGAKPYHQAHERGVKMIGATAHYVTGDLDEGPIIAQDVEQVTHADGPDDLVRKGRDIERRVLSRAVAWHIQDRVLLNDGKTVVFAR